MENKTNEEVKTGFLRAARITRRYARNFYFSSLFLHEEKRKAAYAIYAICRISDEATDKDASLVELSTAKRNIDSVYENTEIRTNLLLAFQQTINKYAIPRHCFEELIDGMYTDFRKNRYKDFSELKDYCYKVAGVVGLMMIRVFGYENYETEKYAINLGIAMQLTNILRDIKEDYHRRGRIYLPWEEMVSFGVTENDIANGLVNENFKSLIRFQIARARGFYRDAEPGFKLITDRRCRFVVYLMEEVYSKILEQIERNNYDVFSRRAQLGPWENLKCTLKAYTRFKKSEG